MCILLYYWANKMMMMMMMMMIMNWHNAGSLGWPFPRRLLLLLSLSVFSFSVFFTLLVVVSVR